MKKSSTPVRDDGTIGVRGIRFKADFIRAAMLETGGVLVVDKDIMEALDRGMAAHFADKGPDAELPASLVIEAIPAIRFVPRRIRLHGSPGVFWNQAGERTNAVLYFAVKRIFHA